MSRIGKQPVIILDSVTVDLIGQTFHAKGPKGDLSVAIPESILVTIENKQVIVTCKDDAYHNLHGLLRTLIFNAVEGVKNGFSKKLEVIGVGFKTNMQGAKLILNIGFSHTVEFNPPQGIMIELDKEKDSKNGVIISGADKQLVGETAAKIRSLRKPEPYKGKGIRYFGEKVRRKAGKSAAK